MTMINRRFIPCLFPLILSGCPVEGSVQTETERTARQAYDELIALHAEAPCTTANHCSVVPIGHKACGGPAGHVPISTLSANMDKALSLAAENRALAEKENQASSMISDCSLVIAPAVQCVAETCVLVSGDGGGAND